MTRLEALQALAEKVEAGLSVSWQLYKRAIPEAPDDTYQPLFCRWSLDAAKALHEAVLCSDDPQYGYMVGPQYARIMHPSCGAVCDVQSDSPARAWLLAILKALIAIEQDKGNE